MNKILSLKLGHTSDVESNGDGEASHTNKAIKGKKIEKRCVPNFTKHGNCRIWG